MRTRLFDFKGVKKSAFFKAAGVIFLGALGSGLWESLLKPGLVRISYGLLTLSSLGIESLRTGIYERIATGSTALASVQSMALLTVFGTCFLTSLFSGMFGLMQWEQRDFELLERRVEMRNLGVEIQRRRETTIEDLEKGRRKIRNNRRQLYAFGFLILLMIGMFLVDVSRIAYETSAVQHYQQVLKITSPYLSDADRRDVESKFAQIRSRTDYIAIVDGLSDTAKAHGKRIPKFKVW
jgi:hypothetical protein